MLKSCSNPCFSDWSFGKRLNKRKDKFPVCKTEQDLKCFYEAAVNVKTPKYPMKECTKLQYSGVTNRFVDQKSNEAIYQVVFSSPPKVSVKEEYLIYDSVAMVSSIGGTMGLCIGFSFYNLTSFVKGWLEIAIRWTKGIRIEESE